MEAANESTFKDGGGIRGLSVLLILREALYRMQQQQGLAEIPRPCDVFDLAGGSGTGGYDLGFHIVRNSLFVVYQNYRDYTIPSTNDH